MTNENPNSPLDSKNKEHGAVFSAKIYTSNGGSAVGALGLGPRSPRFA